MNGILIAFQIVLLVPLFVGTWRTSLLGLSMQGFLMAWIAFRHGFHLSIDTAIEAVDLILLRAITGPVLLYRVLLQQNAPRKNDVISPNLLSWVIAFALVLIAFRLADMVVPGESELQLLVAVSTAALLLGFLVLSTRTGPLSQLVGLFRIENAIALFELGAVHQASVGLRIGQTTLLLASILYFRWYLQNVRADDEKAPVVAAPERPAL
jgi:hydrogenase-4 membrane subunit HyfE